MNLVDLFEFHLVETTRVLPPYLRALWPPHATSDYPGSWAVRVGNEKGYGGGHFLLSAKMATCAHPLSQNCSLVIVSFAKGTDTT